MNSKSSEFMQRLVALFFTHIAIILPLAAVENSDLQRSHSVFLPLLYQYIIGGFFFAFAITFAIKVQSISLKVRHDRMTIAILIIGFFFYLFLHTFWILQAMP